MKKKAVSLLISLILILSFAFPSFASGTKLIALTFDDGPGPYTQELLNGLRARNAKATFFIVGKNVGDSYSKLVQQAYIDGHQIASHTYNHKQLNKISDAEIENQLSKTADKLGSAIGRTDLTYILRPPYGAYNNHTKAVIKLPQIYWSVDPQDWRYKNADTVYSNVIKNAADGRIILLHDIHKTSVSAALKIVDALRKDGYEFVTLNEMARRKGIVLSSGNVYKKFSGETIPGSKLGITAEPRYKDGFYEITLSANDGSEIYYTLDGSSPALYGVKYNVPVHLYRGQSIRAAAVCDFNGDRSPEYSFSFTDGGAVNREYAINVLYKLAGSPKPGSNSEFSDASGAAISWAAENGITTGYGDGTFRPYADLTREQFAAMYFRYANVCHKDTGITADISEFVDYESVSEYAKGPFAYMVGEDIIHGKSGSRLAPKDPLTFRQVDTILNNLKQQP